MPGAMPPSVSSSAKLAAPYLVEFTGTLFLTLVVEPLPRPWSGTPMSEE